MDKLAPLAQAFIRARGRSQRRPSRDRDNHNNNTNGQGSSRANGAERGGDMEALLHMLAKALVAYAVKRYLDSDHNARRQREGGAPIDFETLERTGKRILSKVMDPRRGDDDQAQGGEGLEGRSRRRSRRRRHESHDGRDGRDGHGHQRHGRHGDDGNHHQSGALPPAIVVTPPTASSSSTSHHHKRHDRKGKQPEAAAASSSSGDRVSHQHTSRAGQPLDLSPLRQQLEAMANTLVELNARGASDPNQHRHRDGECEFYDKFVDRSGPLQDDIGRVLEEMREVEHQIGGRREREGHGGGGRSRETRRDRSRGENKVREEERRREDVRGDGDGAAREDRRHRRGRRRRERSVSAWLDGMARP